MFICVWMRMREYLKNRMDSAGVKRMRTFFKNLNSDVAYSFLSCVFLISSFYELINPLCLYFVCLFVCCLSSHSRIFYSYGESQHCRWRAVNFDLCSAFMVTELFVFFNVPHVLFSLVRKTNQWFLSCLFIFFRVKHVKESYFHKFFCSAHNATINSLN